MSPDKLDLTPLSNAIARLREGIARYLLDTSDTQIRDGLILRFQIAYEMSFNALKRLLEATSTNPSAFATVSLEDLTRAAHEHGLSLGDWGKWKALSELRTRAGETGDDGLAMAVAAETPNFLQDAEHLHSLIAWRL